ncbi:uncharacterized protein LOC134753782 [Cydia strobilella]|uniref:uncharacterized protein LOC134753782 n=1 Tax=Cydia strobilella TaxID=1100964 RepID=UPI00300534D2
MVNLEEKLCELEKNEKENNIILFGLQEDENSTDELFEKVKEKVKNDLNIELSFNEINKIHRIGRKSAENKAKGRPVRVAFVREIKKRQIMKERKQFKDIYASEDYPKEIQSKRKELQTKVQEEREKGNTAYINYDKLVVLKGNIDSRKRPPSRSPQQVSQPTKLQATLDGKTNRVNAFDVMRSRSNSLSATADQSNTINN